MCHQASAEGVDMACPSKTHHTDSFLSSLFDKRGLDVLDQPVQLFKVGSVDGLIDAGFANLLHFSGQSFAEVIKVNG